MATTAAIPVIIRRRVATRRPVRATVGFAATAMLVSYLPFPGPLTAMAGTANNVIRQRGGALGVAVIGAVLAAGLAAGHTPLDVVRTCLTVLVVVLATSTVLAGALLARRI